MYGFLASLFGIVFKQVLGLLLSDEVVEYKYAGDLEIGDNENIIEDFSWIDNPRNIEL